MPARTLTMIAIAALGLAVVLIRVAMPTRGVAEEAPPEKAVEKQDEPLNPVEVQASTTSRTITATTKRVSSVDEVAGPAKSRPNKTVERSDPLKAKAAIRIDETPVAVATSTSVSRAASPSANKNWPLFRGDRIATGVAKAALPEKLDVVWNYEVENGAFEATPAILDGVVYLGDLDGEVYAFDLKTGKKRWTYETESGFIASPAVKDGLLYVGDFDGRLHCLDISNGKLKWAYETNAEIDACVNFYKENIVFGSQDATLYCLNAKSGKLVWKYEIDDQIRCSATIAGNRTFVAGCDSLFHVIDLDKGEEVTNVPIEAPTMSTPAGLGDHVFFGTEGGAFFSVNWKGDAKIVWTFTDERASQPIRSSAAVTKDRVVFGSRSKKVYALNPTDGKEIWRFATRQRVDCSPVIVGKRVFVGAADGRLYGLDLDSGEKQWEFEARGGFTGSPAVADGHMIIATDRGIVYCFGAKE